MKRILIIAAVVALSAGAWFSLTKNGPAPGTDPKRRTTSSDAASPALDLSALNKPAPRRPVVEPYKDLPLVPPPSAPPAGWVQPKFAEAKGKLILHPPVGTAPGLPAVARVEIGNETHELHPNEVGNFERLHVARKTKLPFTVGYPTGQPGDLIIAVAEDSGSLGKDSVVAKVPLDADLTARFEFATADRDGLFRVSIRKGADVKALEFWAGPGPAFAKTN